VRFQAIPGPRGYPLLGAFPQARRDPLGFFLAAQRTYGDVVALPLGVRRLYLLCHPDHIKDVLQDHESVFHKSVALSASSRSSAKVSRPSTATIGSGAVV